MKEREKHLALLFTAELQFRLATAVRVATTRGVQPLDLPMDWALGKHRVKYDEIALRRDQGEHAAYFIQQSATFLMAVAIKDAIGELFTDPKSSSNNNVRSAYQISRLIRNAFAHGPFNPAWSIDPDCQNEVFEIADVIRLDTTGLQNA